MKYKDIKLRNGHLLKYIGGDLWEFICAEEWMHIRFIYADNNHDIIALDADGMGMPLCVGCRVKKYKIHSIFINDDKIIVAMKLLIKEKIEDLKSGDILWITDSHNLYDVSPFKIKHIEYNDMPRIKWYKITSESNRIILIQENDKSLVNDGIEAIIDSNKEYVFTNENAAKKYLYDVIQNKINNLRTIQKNLMLKS